MPAWPSHRMAALQASHTAAWQAATTTDLRDTRWGRPTAAVGLSKGACFKRKAFGVRKDLGFLTAR